MVPDGGADPVAELSPPANVLLLVPTHDPADREVCLDLLTITDPADENIWSLGITLSPDIRVKNWQHRVGTPPADFSIVSGRPMSQSDAEAAAKSYGLSPGPRFTTIQHPSDLTRLGIEFTTALDEWAENDEQTVVCFHSLTALLEFADLGRAIPFLHNFVGLVDGAGAFAHYHLDPGTQDERTLARVRSLFDAVIEPADDGGWVVHTR